MAPSLAASLASLTGLDEETASTQLLPHLNSLPSQVEVRTYLDSLLAPGPAAQSFTQSYIAQRFPTAPAPSSSTGQQHSGRRWGASPSASANNSRSASPLPPHQNKADLEKAFAGAGGRVYVKERDDDAGGWGGTTSSKKGSAATSRASSTNRSIATSALMALAPPIPVFDPAPTPSPAPGSISSRASSAQGGKGKGKQQEDGGLELSEEAVRELGEIEKALKGFQPNSGKAKGREKRCFCQARQHPLSPYVPLCPSCALVICTLNAPSLPCPSCSHSPLLSSALSASYIATLQTQREYLLERERARVKREKDQAERERAAIRFPELGAEYQGVDRRMAGGGYAAHAGGGMSLRDRIDRAYEAGTTLSGQQRTTQSQQPQQGKVLRLGANGKVKVQTKRLVATSKGKSRLEEQTVSTIDPGASDDDEESPFVDEDDDGLRGEIALLSIRAHRESWATEVEQRPSGTYVRITLPEEDRPVYNAAEENARYGAQDDDGGDEGARSPGVSTTTAAHPSAGISLVQEKLNSRPTVVGAAKPKDQQEGEGKGKRRRGRGAKGANEAQANVS
ncbi:hypothetical protein JCM11251_001822 [Rhodosporidiobolus azoricus]